MAGKPAEDPPTEWEFTEVSTQQAFASGVARSDDVLANGTALGEYRVDEVIGRGGGGIVYAATHRVLGRRVAIKVLRAEMAAFPKMVARFVQEAVAVNKIRHPNIVDIYEFGELAPGRPYYVMELLEGLDLRRALELHGRYAPREILELLEPIFLAVQAAHDAGIIHRDLKANNIVIAHTPAGRVIKLLDFGIAKQLHEEGAGQGLTEPGAVLGTAHNMSPEQVRGERPDPRADIYALGVLMYHLLTAQYPFDGSEARHVALLHLQAPPPRPSALAPLSPAVDAVVLRCLEKSPDRRYASVNELAAALRAAVQDASSMNEGQSQLALAAYFEVKGAGDEPEDELFEDLSNVFEALERELGARNFAVPLRTSSSLLAVRLLGSQDASAERAAVEAIGEVEALLKARPGAHPALSVEVTLQVGQVLCRGGQIVGGPLLKTAHWRS